jgi:hypothetical protein
MDGVPVFEPEDQTSVKRRGVTVVTQYGRAVSFGMSRDRTEKLLKSMAQRRGAEMLATMVARKIARWRDARVAGPSRL